jgi:hypothetical protein
MASMGTQHPLFDYGAQRKVKSWDLTEPVIARPCKDQEAVVIFRF